MHGLGLPQAPHHQTTSKAGMYQTNHKALVGVVHVDWCPSLTVIPKEPLARISIQNSGGTHNQSPRTLQTARVRRPTTCLFLDTCVCFVFMFRHLRFDKHHAAGRFCDGCLHAA